MKETKEIMENEASELSLMNEESKDAEVLCEDVSRRKENTKHFRMKNGNFMAVVYDEPVHKLNEKTGEFEEIKGEFTENETDFEASMKAFKVKLPKKEGKRKFVTVEKDGKSVSFRFASGKPTHTKRPEAMMHSEKKHYWEHKKYPTVKYEKVDNITSLEYEVNDGGIKENIVLTKCPETSTFKFDIKCDGLVPKLSEDKKTVVLLDEREETVMVIPPANMTDDNGVYSEEIHYELCETEEGITLEMVVENDWLSAYERKYPVIIDPRIDVITNYSTSSILMKEICSNGDLVSYAETRMIGMDTNGNIHRTYIKLPAVNLANTAKIIKAELKFFNKNYIDDGGSYGVYKSSSSLDISNLTWSNQGTIYSSDKLATFYSYNSSKAVDITDLMEEMRSSGTSKMVVLKKTSETPTVTYPVSTLCLPGEGGNEGGGNEGGGNEGGGEVIPPEPVTIYGSVTIHSNTSGTVSKRPTAFIEYVPSDVYVTNKAQYTFECGAAGTGAIDLNTGSLTFVHNDGIGSGFRYAPPVAHIYKTEYMDKTEASSFGKGWALSPIQSLEVYGSGSTYKAKYTDSVGNIYYFVQNSDGTITDELGLGWTYSTESISFPGYGSKISSYCITDEHNNRILFDSNKKFMGILNIENKGFVAFANDSGQCIAISEESLEYADTRNLTFDYNASGSKLSAINDYIMFISGENALVASATMVYTSAGLLHSITTPDNKTTKFTYYDNRLTCIEDYMGIECAFAYDNNGRVISIISRGNNNVTDNGLVDGTLTNNSVVDFEYRTNSVAVVNGRTKVKTVYVLDDMGRERYSYVDLSAAVNTTKRTPTTLIHLNEYSSIVHPSSKYANGEYISMTASVEGDDAHQTNYITNGCFTDGSTGWSKGQSATSGYSGVSSTSYIENTTSKSYYFDSTNTGNDKWISQTVNVNPNSLKGNILVASAWAKASDNSPSVNSDAKFRMIVDVAYSGTAAGHYEENFDVGCTSWQCVAVPIALNKNLTSATITIKLDYSYNIGNCYFTNVRLVEADTTFTTNEYFIPGHYAVIYNGFENVGTLLVKHKITKENSQYIETEYYDDKSDKIAVFVKDKSAGVEYKSHYKYDDKHRTIKTKDYHGIIRDITYKEYNDKSMNVTLKEYHESTPSKYKYSSDKYDSCGRKIKETDPRLVSMVNGTEIVSSYNYDNYKNVIKDFTPPNGQQYTYTHNNKNELIKLSTTIGEDEYKNEMNYVNGFLTRAKSNGNIFTFAYDEIGRVESIKIGATELVRKSYTNTAEPTVTTTYANNSTVKLYSDIFGNAGKCEQNSVETFTSDYLPNGGLNYLVDNKKGIRYNYKYNNLNDVTEVEKKSANNSTLLSKDTFAYDNKRRVTSRTYGETGHTYSPIYEKDSSGNIYPEGEAIGINLNGKYSEKINKDTLRRPSSKTFTLSSNSTPLFTDTYSYMNIDGNVETDYVLSHSTSVFGDFLPSNMYTYDDMGNIYTVDFAEDITNVHHDVVYQYDAINRLTREDNVGFNATYTYTYDKRGNITCKNVYPLGNINVPPISTYSYVYSTDGWLDRLARFGNKSCEYDYLGNPTIYKDNSLKWNGRQLTKFGNHTFDYDANGIRFKKNTITYSLDGDKILKETDGTNTITYYYGVNGIVGLNYNGIDYYYRKNLQGDVIEIYTASGTLAASYIYDAWGNHLVLNAYGAGNTSSTFIGNVNPIRYRGYYFDRETGLYYLQTRYYDPETGRFISPDSLDYLDPETLGGINLYAYCNNNPVMYSDGSGHAPEWLGNLLTGIGIVLGTALFVTAIVASAGTFGALVGVGAAAIGLSTTAVSTAITIATISTYVVAGGVALFGASDAVEAFSGGINPIRDYVMGGNQMAYNITSGIFNALGTIAVIAGMVGPKVLQKIAQRGVPKISNGKTVGYSMDFFDKKGNWNFRIDATTHGNPNSANWHHNPHYHVVTRGGNGNAVYYLWEVIKGWF